MRQKYDNPDYHFNGDSLIQLDDGSLLSFYFSMSSPLKIYDQKEFKEKLSIDLKENLKEHNKKIMYNDEEEDEDEENKSFQLTVIQLKNKSILVGYYNYLIEIKLNDKNFESKVIFKDKDYILNINELSDGRIILITNNSILVLKDLILKDKYNIKKNWKIVPLSLTNRYCGDFNQYFSSNILPDERILIRSFSTELSYHGGCGTHPPDEFTHSKIIFLNTKNFEEIKTTEEFESDCRALVFENLIIIQVYHDIYLYDIKTLENIKKMEIDGRYCYFEKYNENEIIAYSIYESVNDLLIYRVEGYDIIKSLEIKKKFKFRPEIGWNFYSIIRYNNKILFVLKDKRVILLCHDSAILFNLEL